MPAIKPKIQKLPASTRPERTVIMVDELAAVFDISRPSLAQLRYKCYGPKPIDKTTGKRGKPVFYRVASVEEYLTNNLRKWRNRLERLKRLKANGDLLPEHIYTETYGEKRFKKRSTI